MMELQERSNSLRDYINIIKRRKSQMLITFVSLMALTALVSFGLPSVYRSTATILLEEQEVSDDFDKRQSNTEYADARVYKVQQRALTSTNLSKIIEDLNLYVDDINRLPRSEIIEKMRKEIRQDLVSADVIDPRSGRPTRVTIAFDLSFDHRSASMAQRVANELVTLYRRENIDQGLSAVNDTALFYEKQVSTANEEVLALEDRLARFKAENEGALPEFVPMIMQLMQKTEGDAAEAQRQLAALEERRIFLESTLIQTDPYSGGNPQLESLTDPNQQIEIVRGQLRSARATYGENHPDVKRLTSQLATLTAEAGGDFGQDTSAIDLQVAEAAGELATARRNYSGEHPEVKRLERQLGILQGERNAALSGAVSTRMITPARRINEFINIRAAASAGSEVLGQLLKGSKAQLLDSNLGEWALIRLSSGIEGFVSKSVIVEVSSSARPGGATRQGAATNPAYINLQANVATVVSQMRALQATYLDLTAKAQGYSTQLSQAPSVEREYSAIMRDLLDRRTLLQTYKQELDRARFGQDVIAGQRGQKFTLIEPPIAPPSPHSPNRIALLFLGLVLSLFGTIAAAVIAESLDNAVRKASDVLDVSGSTPLAAIPVIANHSDIVKSKRSWMIGIVAAVVSLIVILTTVHFTYRKLDVLWFLIARKLGF